MEYAKAGNSCRIFYDRNIRPYGLDCSGFSTWVFNTAVGVDIGAGTSGQYPNSVAVSASELLPGDLGFLAESDGADGTMC